MLDIMPIVDCKTIQMSDLQKFLELFEKYFGKELTLPKVSDTINADELVLSWHLRYNDIQLIVNLKTNRDVIWKNLNTRYDHCYTMSLDLNQAADWTTINDEIAWYML